MLANYILLPLTDTFIWRLRLPLEDASLTLGPTWRKRQLDVEAPGHATALGSDEDRARGLQCGADAYLVKSAFDQDALLETLRQLA